MSKAGLTSFEHSLKSSFTKEEEEVIVTIFLLRARQETPLIIDAFIGLVTFLAERDEDHRFSRHFVSLFITRHEIDICIHSGKITSPTRSKEVMLKKTKEFINMFQWYVDEGLVTKETLVVF